MNCISQFYTLKFFCNFAKKLNSIILFELDGNKTFPPYLPLIIQTIDSYLKELQENPQSHKSQIIIHTTQQL